MRYWQQKCSSTLWRVFLEGESLLCSTYPWFIPGCRGSWPLAVSISSVVDHVPFPWAAHCTVRESYLYKVIVMLYWERKKRRVTTLYLADVTGGKQARVVVVWSLQLCSFGFCEFGAHRHTNSVKLCVSGHWRVFRLRFYLSRERITKW